MKNNKQCNPKTKLELGEAAAGLAEMKMETITCK